MKKKYLPLYFEVTNFHNGDVLLYSNVFDGEYIIIGDMPIGEEFD